MILGRMAKICYNTNTAIHYTSLMGVESGGHYEDEAPKQPPQPAAPAEAREHAEVPFYESTTGAFLTDSLNALREETGWSGDFVGITREFVATSGLSHGTELDITIDGKTIFGRAKIVTRTVNNTDGFSRTTMLPRGLRVQLGVEKRKDKQSLGTAIQIKIVEIEGQKALLVRKKQ